MGFMQLSVITDSTVKLRIFKKIKSYTILSCITEKSERSERFMQLSVTNPSLITPISLITPNISLITSQFNYPEIQKSGLVIKLKFKKVVQVH